jgi:hypothetical protein
MQKMQAGSFANLVRLAARLGVAVAPKDWPCQRAILLIRSVRRCRGFEVFAIARWLLMH